MLSWIPVYFLERPGQQGEVVESVFTWKSIKLCLGTDNELRAKMSDTVVGVYYRPPDQDKEVDEAFYGQLEVALRSPGSSLDIQQPCICWRSNVAWQTQSRKFLQILEDNFLVQVVGEPMRKGVLPSRGPFPLQQFCDSVNLNLCILRYQHPQISLCRAALQSLINPFRLVSGTTLYQMQNPWF